MEEEEEEGDVVVRVSSQRDPRRIKVDGFPFAVQKEIDVKIFSWKPRKDLAGSGVGKKATDTSEDSDEFGSLDSDTEGWESNGKDSSVPTSSTAFPKVKITPQDEKEDWDKELADSENSKHPYDFDDYIHCGDFLDGDSAEPYSPYSVQRQPLYDPSLHHVAPLSMSRIAAVLVDGQFDDAVD